jgi:hypothetical protein
MQLVLAAAMVAPIAGALAQSQSPVVHASRGQSEQQMARDDSKCHSAASKQTGFDPVVIAANSAPFQHGKDMTSEPIAAPSTAMGASSAGATSGAAGGVEMGATAGGSTGASAGGATGSSAGQPTRKAQQFASQKPSIDVYNRAYSKCMNRRGYVVEQTSGTP